MTIHCDHGIYSVEEMISTHNIKNFDGTPQRYILRRCRQCGYFQEEIRLKDRPSVLGPWLSKNTGFWKREFPWPL